MIAGLDPRTQALLAQAEMCRRRLHYFVRKAWPLVEPGRPFVDNWHIRAICDHLEAVTRRDITRLAINIPYRCSKSLIVSVFWPAWIWANDPGEQLLCLSHADGLATRDTRRMRNLVQSSWFQARWPITFSRDENMKTRFSNDEMGHRIAAGMLAGFTGEGADLIVIDDPMDRDRAQSETYRQAYIEAFDEKVCTRLNDPDGGAIVAIGQRLHQEDLFGHIYDQQGDQWTRLVIPMEYEPDHPYPSNSVIAGKPWVDPRSVPGHPDNDGTGLLWPARFPRHVVDREKRRGLFFAAGQLQQRPSPRGGMTFKLEWVHVRDEAPAPGRFRRLVRYWDKAASQDEGDYTAGLLMGIDDQGCFWILDVIHGQWDVSRRDDNIDLAASLDDTEWREPGPGVYTVFEQEPGSGGKQSGQISVKRLAGYRAKAVPVSGKGSKVVRAESLASMMGAGNVFLLKGRWNKRFIDELLAFPAGRNDDQVDAASGAFGELATRNTRWIA